MKVGVGCWETHYGIARLRNSRAIRSWFLQQIYVHFANFGLFLSTNVW